MGPPSGSCSMRPAELCARCGGGWVFDVKKKLDVVSAAHAFRSQLLTSTSFASMQRAQLFFPMFVTGGSGAGSGSRSRRLDGTSVRFMFDATCRIMCKVVVFDVKL